MEATGTVAREAVASTALVGRHCEAIRRGAAFQSKFDRRAAVGARMFVTADLPSAKVAYVRRSAPDATAHRSRQ